MAWKTTWNDPLTNYVAPYHQLMGDKRTRTTFDGTIRGIMGAGSLILKWMEFRAPDAKLLLRALSGDFPPLTASGGHCRERHRCRARPDPCATAIEYCPLLPVRGQFALAISGWFAAGTRLQP
jgi:hypothetical protein